MMTEARSGFTAFNEGPKEDREVDFVLLRQKLAAPVKIWLDRDGKLLRLRLDRPKANILDAAMNAALEAALDSHGHNAELRAILIDAEGPHFSFGASVEEHLPEQCAAMLDGFHRLVLKVLRSSTPVMVALRGQCLGGGLELASAAHLLFATPDAKLGQPEIELGVFAPAASCLLPERIGLAAAEDLLLSGRSITGEEALAMGLVTALADDPDGGRARLVRQRTSRSKSASVGPLRRSRRTRGSRRASRRSAAKLAAVEKLYLSGIDERRGTPNEGLTAFLEKRRPPVWEHH
jgi:cyclohexa-1,5-dienecarbonyl-CoA hydratase